MGIFLTGIIVLFAVSAIFYIVLFSFIYYWHLKDITYVIVPLMLGFEFFAKGFFIVSLIAFILYYVPYVLRAFGV